MLEIRITFESSIPVFNLKGRFDGYGASLFDKETTKINDEINRWVIDFSDVDYLSSAGIRSLIKVEKSLRSREGGLILVGLSSDLTKVLELTGLLGQFCISDSLSEALKQVEETTIADKTSTQYLINNRDYVLRWLSDQGCILDLWGSFDKVTRGDLSAENLIGTNLQELGYAFGIAGLGHSKNQAFEAIGEFVSGETFAGIIPADGHCLSDFLITDKPSDAEAYILSAIGFSGKPAGVLEVKSGSSFTLEDLIVDIFDLVTDEKGESPSLVGLIIMAEADEIVYTHFKTQKDMINNEYCEDRFSEEKAVIIIGIAGDKTSLESSEYKSISHFIERIDRYPINRNRFFLGHGVILSELATPSIDVEPDDNIRSIVRLDNLKGVAHFNPHSKIKNGEIWFYLPQSIRSADEKRLKIELEDGTELKDEWQIIVRRIYSETGRIVLSQLHGGFTSKTFRVTSYDKDGRRLLPTILKIGSIRNTENEVSAYHNFVKKFILNNSVTIMGTTYHSNWGGLRYNFVGINGPESKLTWLTDYYRKLPTERLIPLFDRIFTQILKPWYGQPKWEVMYPYEEHNPLSMFSEIFSAFEKEFGVSADKKTVYCQELGIELPNPYHFLKYEYPKRKKNSTLWYESVTHGDLNMQNILLDEIENIYVIDFSETKPRNIVSDFARLEPIFKIEMTHLENENDLKELLEFEAGLAEANSIGEKPLFKYKGSDPMVEKAYEMICRMRKYADIVTLFDNDIVPYLLAILEWTYPIVCYTGLGFLRKKLSVYSAGLICQKIIQLDRVKTPKTRPLLS